MINIDDKITAYRKEKTLRFQSFIDEIHQKKDYVQTWVETSYGNIQADIYRGSQCNQSAPVYFNFHGGGFVLGYHELDGPYCKILADKANCVVVNVDYLLAPEYKFPIGIYSSLEVLNWCLKHAKELGIDPNYVVIGGHSAGGNLAIGLTRLLLDQKFIGLKGLLIDYAPCSQDIDDPSSLDNEEIVQANRNFQYMSWYFKDIQECHHPLASPCYQDVMGFPETLMICAEYDGLRAGEEVFKSLLQKNHIRVEYHCFLGCDHGFTHQYYDEYQEQKSEKAWQIMADFLIRCFKMR